MTARPKLQNYLVLAGKTFANIFTDHAVMDRSPRARVVLSPQNMLTAAFVGVRRQCFAMAKQLEHYGQRPESVTKAFDHHIIGAMAEYAVAKYFNLFWDENVGILNGRDVGGLIEVRARRPDSGLDLAIRTTDNNNKAYLLVYVDPPVVDLIGWLYGEEGKTLGQWNERSSLFYVTPDNLKRVEELYCHIVFDRSELVSKM